MASMKSGQFPPPGVTTLPGTFRRLDEAEQMRQRFAQIVCGFCRRARAELKPGGVAGPTPEIFICPDCIDRAKEELLAS